MISFDILPLDERFVDRQHSGDEFDAERCRRAALQLDELCAANFFIQGGDAGDERADAASH